MEVATIMKKDLWKDAPSMTMDAATLTAILTAVDTQSDYVTLDIAPDGSVSSTARSVDAVTLIRIVTPPGTMTGTLCTERCTFPTDRFIAALKGLRGNAVIDWIPGLWRVGDGRFRTSLAVEFKTDDPVRMPDLSFPASAMVNSDALRTLTSKTDVKNATAYTLRVSPDGLTIDSTDDSCTGAELTVPASECTLVEGTASASYPWVPWTAFLKAVPKGSDVLIELDRDYPCRVSFAGEGWEGLWLVAPRIGDDDL